MRLDQNLEQFTLRIAVDSDKEDIRRWRNQPHVRASMINQDEIPPETHMIWWDKTKSDPARRVFLLCFGATPVAVLNFFDITSDGSAWWGFYLTDQTAPDHDELTIWLTVESIALRYAFERLNLRWLLCETRATNTPVLMLHDRFGFETLPSDDFANAVEHDLVVKRLNRDTYDSCKDHLIAPQITAINLPDDPHPPQLPRLAFIGAANWDEVAANLSGSIEAHCPLRLKTHVPPFGQGVLELLTPGSDMAENPPDYLVFCDRAEDFLPPLTPATETAISEMESRFDVYLDDIRRLREMYGGHFLVHDLHLVRPHVQSLNDMTARQGPLNAAIDRMNRELAQTCTELADCTLLPVSRIIEQIGHDAADSGKYWLMGRFPYGPRFTPAYHRLLTGALMALHGLTARALVLDLDNTLWGGVIGDDGTFGIQLGSDYPGNQFTAFQHFVKSLSGRGLVLTLCSKNTENTALAAFRDHPDMVLCESDLLTHRINWSAKSANIAEIAAEIDLGPGSLMFIDDNPMEREEVRQNLPGVIVPEMPADVAQWPGFLASHPALCALQLLDQDRDRATKYRIRQQILQVEQSAPDKQSFLRKLGMKIEIATMRDATRARALQLFAKTNQFNTTTIRYSEQKLDTIRAENGDILTVRIKDKFGSDEVIAALVVTYGATVPDAARIENFVMSCRVLGRGVETAILAEICRRALARGCATLLGPIVETERNQPCRDVYARHDFAAQPDGVFACALDKPVAFPDWFEYISSV
ncbi:MAG: HAD-IIIC family phosphatase [Pseudomonadota bacterium]|uniref:HAD-IIIC family phosphatase n=1 Tax=Roseovarius TaxID=74030 RepID=UPI0022A72ADA|nr:HAD-IIIC family phosphatase [Roseovarius sp. EGI FJ00037]MCZ0811375.1 HAD-IIIC family phosphatase [Roseovarius sp. EGI FJ00037]